MPFVSQKDGESSFQAIQTPRSSLAQVDVSAVDAMENWQLDPELTQMDLLSTYWRPGMDMRTSAADVVQEPSTWIKKTDDVFESTAQIGQMLGFCRSCA